MSIGVIVDYDAFATINVEAYFCICCPTGERAGPHPQSSVLSERTERRCYLCLVQNCKFGLAFYQSVRHEVLARVAAKVVEDALRLLALGAAKQRIPSVLELVAGVAEGKQPSVFINGPGHDDAGVALGPYRHEIYRNDGEIFLAAKATTTRLVSGVPGSGVPAGILLRQSTYKL